MVKIANEIREDVYDNAVVEYGDKELKETLQDFKNYHYEPITSVEEIGMENWFMIESVKMRKANIPPPVSLLFRDRKPRVCE